MKCWLCHRTLGSQPNPTREIPIPDIENQEREAVENAKIKACTRVSVVQMSLVRVTESGLSDAGIEYRRYLIVPMKDRTYYS